LQYEDSAKGRVVQERAGNYEFVFGSQFVDVGHVLFLKFFSRFFAQWGSVGGAAQQHDEVVGGRVGLGLRKGRAWQGEQG
jgi:hypothetical protein